MESGTSSRGYFWALLGGMAAIIVLFLLLEKPAAETAQPPMALQLSDVIDATGKPLRPITVNAANHIVRYANWDWVEQEDCTRYAPGSPDDGKKVPCGITDVVGITYPEQANAEACTLDSAGLLEESPEYSSGFDAYATYSYFGRARKGPLLNADEECPTFTIVILPKDFVDNGAYVGEPTRQREALAAARALARAADESAASAD